MRVRLKNEELDLDASSELALWKLMIICKKRIREVGVRLFSKPEILTEDGQERTKEKQKKYDP